MKYYMKSVAGRAGGMSGLCTCVALLQLLCLPIGMDAVVVTDTRVDNQEQCGRLCWYRPVCAAYSVAGDLQDPGNTVNCRLHDQQDVLGRSDCYSGFGYRFGTTMLVVTGDGCEGLLLGVVLRVLVSVCVRVCVCMCVYVFVCVCVCV